ncbi:AraC family transcriptional regulator [Alcanivorax limicola]|uniref:AraC family transcriptional regulator n=1 Tax=Alcanivorax limicola TaxID=2874102 RepID=UPI001CBD178F|nr:AraC family transcriptional regulator [Alcanivorax limicola]
MNSVQTRPLPANQPGVPAIYLLLLCDVVKSLGFDDHQVIEGLGVDRSSLLDGQRRVSLQICHTAACRAVAMAGDRGLGLAYAQALNVTLHGSLGMMALSSPSITAAMNAATEYVTLRAPFLSVTQVFDGDTAVIQVAARWSLGELDRFVMEAMLAGLAHMAGQLLGAPLDGAEIRLTGACPDYVRAGELLGESGYQVPVPITYGHDSCQLRAPASLLEVAPRLANPTVAALAREQCEQEFRQLFAAQTQPPGMVERITDMLRDWPQNQALPSQDEVAGLLHTSTSTLKRRLREEGSNYRDLMEVLQSERARELLEDGRLGISEVAWRLGYNDVSNFSRAFRRWTGKTPRQWRGGA